MSTDHKIELSAAEFIVAVKEGQAKDITGKSRIFSVKDSPKNRIIKDVVVNGNVFLKEEHLEGKVVLEDCKIEYLYIQKCHFAGGLKIDTLNIVHDLMIRDCKIEDAFLIEDSFVGDDLSISGLSFVGSEMRIENNTAKSIWVYNSSIKSEFWFDMNFTRTDIDDCIIETLTLWHIPEKTNLSVAECEISQLMLDGFVNLGYMQWNTLKTENIVIHLEGSVMGKWDIINCNFSKAQMVIYSSKITDAFYTNSKFPGKLNIPEKIGDKENPHEILRDGYNQLKTLAQKQNDRGMYLHYQAAELRSYHQTLSGDGNHRATRFQLWAMKWSNEYGTNWWRGVWFVAGFNLFFVSLAFCDRPFQFDWNGIGNYWAAFFASLFALISTPKYFVSNWEVIVFYFSRIFIAFGIYQTIAAFRKFGKSE